MVPVYLSQLGLIETLAETTVKDIKEHKLWHYDIRIGIREPSLSSVQCGSAAVKKEWLQVRYWNTGKYNYGQIQKDTLCY